MKRRDGYMVRELAGECYLMPFGQHVADRKHGMKLNETGLLLWELLAQDRTETELVNALIAEYGLEESDRADLTADVRAFVNILTMLDLLDTPPVLCTGAACRITANIGGLTVKLCSNTDLVPADFAPFAVPDDTPANLTVDLIHDKPYTLTRGEVLLRNASLSVWFDGVTYTLFYPEFNSICEAQICADGSFARLFVTGEINDTTKVEIFHALRHIYLLRAQKLGVFALHSVSVLYRGRAWLFSGHSGMGKSTHTAMWHELLGTPILNGDLNLLSLDDNGKPVVLGLPWCGTSGINTVGSWPLGGVVLLGRADTDHLAPLSPAEQALQTAQRLISPVWTEDMLERNLAFTERITRDVPVYKLMCTKEPSAVETIRAQIDCYLNGKDELTR